MITWIRNKFAPTFYVQIWENKLRVTDLSTKNKYESLPVIAIETLESGEKKIVAIGRQATTNTQPNIVTVNPFSHPRVLFSDFYVGEKLLQHAFSTFAKYRFLRVTPKTVIHPMEKTDGGLTMIEIRAFRELALGAGSIESKVYVGEPLSIASFSFEDIEDTDGVNDLNANHATKGETGLAFTLFVVLMLIGVFYFGAK
ncbi:rod shape-determining protein MreB [Alteromonas gracilis]|uniref:rod shape-determining protein MreB n=1 Tax=Alteromonas gracilis TaxID=1479524 RepID=UPI0030CE8BD0